MAYFEYFFSVKIRMSLQMLKGWTILRLCNNSTPQNDQLQSILHSNGMWSNPWKPKLFSDHHLLQIYLKTITPHKVFTMYKTSILVKFLSLPFRVRGLFSPPPSPYRKQLMWLILLNPIEISGRQICPPTANSYIT